MKKAKKPRKPQDSTRRNIQASNKHFARVGDELERLRGHLATLEERVQRLEQPQPPPPSEG